MARQASPPPSPRSLFRAQLLVTKADQAKKAAKVASKTGSRSKAPKAEKENKSLATASGKRKSPPTIEWRKPENYHYTDTLLTLIEDNATWKVAFGFDKGDVGQVSTGGKRLAEHHRAIARKLVSLSPDRRWTEEDLPTLQDAVKNRINAIKSKYKDLRGKMSETGQGLINEGRQGEIQSGTHLGNLWEHIQATFPWYMRMHVLMGTSPIMMKQAILHSKTPLDLQVLTTNPYDEPSALAHSRSPSCDPNEDIDEESNPGSPRSQNSRLGTPTLDPNLTQHTTPTTNSQPPESLTPASDSVAKTHITPQGQKRKRGNVADQIADVAEQERASRLKLAEVMAKSKEAREETRRQSALEIELTRLRYQSEEANRMREEAVKNRAHEALMMDKQLELARLNSGFIQYQPQSLTLPTHAQHSFPSTSNSLDLSNVDPQLH